MQNDASREVYELKPRNSYAWLHVSINLMLIAGGIALSSGDTRLLVYLTGQLALALGFTHSFILLHEAGHKTLFRQPWLNQVAGWISGFIALIPYITWQPIHARHHRFTGWQDLDATTASLVPRRLGTLESIAINGAWRFWLPLFSLIYRIQNYWNLGRIRRFLSPSSPMVVIGLAISLQGLGYVLLLLLAGVGDVARLLGPGLLLALMSQDLVLLSQHTGMPTNLSRGRAVRAFRPREQVPFTRSLRLPSWLSWLWLHFDAHELHHLYPAVPGYLLRKVPVTTPNEVSWFGWISEVKRLSGTRFLFGPAENGGPD